LRAGRPRQIYVLSSDGGLLRPVLPKNWEAASADWSPYGSRIIVSMRNARTHPEYELCFLDLSTGNFKELPETKGFGQPRWSPNGQFIASLDEASQHLLLFDVRKNKWAESVRGGMLGTPSWSADSSGVYVQDFLQEEEAVFRSDAISRKSERVAGFGEILSGSASQCVFSGLAKDGSLYVMLERGLTEIYALDLDLP
jgi:dipeptidyl aminopeptidase/acylaminoacyl peptidase